MKTRVLLLTAFALLAAAPSGVGAPPTEDQLIVPGKSVGKTQLARALQGEPFDPDGHLQVIIDDQRRTLWRAISQLSGRCQELLRIIAFVPRPDYAAIAAELGMQVGSVGPTRGRCLAKLRALLLANGLEENPR